MGREYQARISLRCDRPECLSGAATTKSGSSGQRALSEAVAEVRLLGWLLTKRETVCPECSALPEPARALAEPEWSTTRPHVCDVCGHQDAWGEGWAHYGSVHIEENCGHLIKTCSSRCRNSARAEDLIADFEARHKYKRGCGR